MSDEERVHLGRMQEDGEHCMSVECWCWNDRYMVVTRPTSDELMEAVNAFIHQKRWRPLGGVQLSVTHRTWENERKGHQESETEVIWAQAMVRHV